MCGVTSKPATALHAAFPGAAGFGADAIGGRGGGVVAVTNLADYDPYKGNGEREIPGSLRAAIRRPPLASLLYLDPRTIVFRTAGTVALKRYLQVTDPYVTIAGQTAPGGGIALRQAFPAGTGTRHFWR